MDIKNLEHVKQLANDLEILSLDFLFTIRKFNGKLDAESLAQNPVLHQRMRLNYKKTLEIEKDFRESLLKLNLGQEITEQIMAFDIKKELLNFITQEEFDMLRLE